MNATELKTAFLQEYGGSCREVLSFFAPGRVNLIGEHIDYNGGYVFPAALSLGIYGALRLRSDRRVLLRSLNAQPAAAFDADQPLLRREADGWANYPKGIICYLRDAGLAIPGCEILFAGDLPDGAGLSSSAALLVLTAYMLRYAAGERECNLPELALFCQRVENEFIGLNCGIMDQFSVAVGRQDCAILLDCETLHYDYVPFCLENHRLVIMNTNKRRSLADSSRYNERRAECDQALAAIRLRHEVPHLCQATVEEVEQYVPDGPLRRRARHAVTENHRVLAAVACLRQGDIPAFGKLLTESHRSLQRDYEVTGPALDTIVDCAHRAPGCIGARMTGAGFGGCAIALVAADDVAAFTAAVTEGYRRQAGVEPDFYISDIADGVKRLED